MNVYFYKVIFNNNFSIINNFIIVNLSKRKFFQFDTWLLYTILNYTNKKEGQIDCLNNLINANKILTCLNVHGVSKVRFIHIIDMHII